MALIRMDNLKKKLEEKALLGQKLVEVEDKIDEIVGDKKSKIKSKKSK